MAERACEHRKNTNKEEEKSYIRTHKEEVHPEEEEELRMKYSVDKRCKSALERQVREAVVIKLQARNGASLMNSKLEYNRCILPELGIINMNEDKNDEAQVEDRKKKEEKIRKEREVKEIRKEEENAQTKYKRRKNFDDGSVPEPSRKKGRWSPPTTTQKTSEETDKMKWTDEHEQDVSNMLEDYLMVSGKIRMLRE